VSLPLLSLFPLNDQFFNTKGCFSAGNCTRSQGYFPSTFIHCQQGISSFACYRALQGIKTKNGIELKSSTKISEKDELEIVPSKRIAKD
jgi:hypothetical protein